jgi:nucleoside-diphosphate-sugar epimerase
VRRPGAPLPRETVIVVSDYFSPPESVLHGMDTVVNFVGVTATADEAHLRSLNVEGPVRLAKHARSHGIRHFIQLSSLHIYGDAELIDRATPEAPLSPYARSKQTGDRALSCEAADGFTVTNLRMPMHYGYGAGEKLRLLATFITRFGWFPVRKDRVERSMVHLDNLSAAIVFLVEQRLGGVQFAADPEPFSVETLAEVAFAKAGKTIKLVRFPEFLFLPLRIFANSVYRRLYRNNVICGDALLGVTYPVKLKQGLKDILP